MNKKRIIYYIKQNKFQTPNSYSFDRDKVINILCFRWLYYLNLSYFVFTKVSRAKKTHFLFNGCERDKNTLIEPTANKLFVSAYNLKLLLK